MKQKKRKEPEELSAGFRDIFIRKNWSALWRTYQLTRQWPKIAGNDVAQKTEPAYIQNDILWIYVQNSVLMQYLQTRKLELLQKVNEMAEGPEIKDIRWAMQPAKPPAKAGSPRTEPRRETDPAAETAFTDMTMTIENDQCREALQKLWRSFHRRAN